MLGLYLFGVAVAMLFNLEIARKHGVLRRAPTFSFLCVLTLSALWPVSIIWAYDDWQSVRSIRR